MRFVLYFSILFFCGCAPVAPIHHFNLSGNDIAGVMHEIDTYNKQLKVNTEIVNSIIFRFLGKTLPAFGVTKINEETRSFSVAALNPMGVSLFQLQVVKGKLIKKYVIPEIGKFGDFAKAVSEDIERIYFDRTLDFSCLPYLFKSDKIIFKKISDNERYDYVFAGTPARLVRKKYYERNRLIWTADYYDYQEQGGYILPMKIFYTSNKYKYGLEINTKEIVK